MNQRFIRQHWQRLGASFTVAVLAFIYSVYAVIGSGATSVIWGFVLLLAGIPVYVWMRKEQGIKGKG